MRAAEREAKKARALAIWKNGGPDLTTAMLAQRMGVSQHVVSGWLRSIGVGGAETRDRAAMIQAWGKGKTK
jgi:hypothetical protein